MEQKNNYDEQMELMQRIKDTHAMQHKQNNWFMPLFLIVWLAYFLGNLYIIASSHQWSTENVGKLCFYAVLAIGVLVSFFMVRKYNKNVSQSETPVKLLAVIDDYKKKTCLYLVPIVVAFLLSSYFWVNDVTILLVVVAILLLIISLICWLNRNHYKDIKRLRELVRQSN